MVCNVLKTSFKGKLQDRTNNVPEVRRWDTVEVSSERLDEGFEPHSQPHAISRQHRLTGYISRSMSLLLHLPTQGSKQEHEVALSEGLFPGHQVAFIAHMLEAEA